LLFYHILNFFKQNDTNKLKSIYELDEQPTKNGIFVWSQPILTRSLESNEEIVILLMQTYTTKSNDSFKEWSYLFSLGLITSSINIITLNDNLGKFDMNNLYLLCEYGKLALDCLNEKPYQRVMLIISQSKYESLDIGQLVFAEDNYDFKQFFSQVDYFSLTSDNLEQIKELIENHLVTQFTLKEINNQKITCKELFEYFKSYCALFAKHKQPEPKSLLQATIEANHLAAKSIAKEYYFDNMDIECGGNKPYLHPSVLNATHDKIKHESKNKYREIKKIGSYTLSDMYERELDKEIDNYYIKLYKHNDSKNIFKISRSLITLIILMICINALLMCFDFVLIRFLLTISYWSCVVLMFIWLYVLLTGDCKDLGLFVDELTDWIWIEVS
jgi:atlastin